MDKHFDAKAKEAFVKDGMAAAAGKSHGEMQASIEQLNGSAVAMKEQSDALHPQPVAHHPKVQPQQQTLAAARQVNHNATPASTHQMKPSQQQAHSSHHGHAGYAALTNLSPDILKAAAAHGSVLHNAGKDIGGAVASTANQNSVQAPSVLSNGPSTERTV
jgi:hypothetical protein